MMLPIVTRYNYIKFLLLNVYDQIVREFPEVSDIHIIKQILIDSFSNSKNLFWKILVINKIKGLEKVSGYLMFVLKKLDAGLIKYDTVVSNLSNDTHFLVKEIVSFFKLDKKISEELEKPLKENIELKVPEKLFILKDLEIDKIEKEFTKENYENGAELELIRNENIINDEIVFTLPDEKIEETKSEPPSREEEIQMKQVEEANKTDIETEGEKLSNYIQSGEGEKESLSLEEMSLKKAVETESLDRTEEINSLYIEFEERVTNRNAKLRDAFNYLLSESKQESEEVIDNIIKVAGEIESYSIQMTFEVIPSLYSIIKDYFICYQLGFLELLDADSLKKFSSYLDLVETLIKGEDLSGFDNIIGSIEDFKKQIAYLKTNQQKTTKVNLNLMKENSFELEEPELNHSERDSYKKIRENILYIKNIFDSIEQIESKYKIYEALTSLSKIFPQLKEIVIEAKQINQIDIARLAEATYIFIKFIQNYRINPFEKEVIEVLKYIIYNFKSLYLNKQAEDLTLFIKYLNNPTKIFENNDTE